MPAHNDSVEKIIQRYFACVSVEQFTFKSIIYIPKPLRISPQIFTRRMTCVLMCGACCSRFTLDWLPSELEKLSSIKSRIHKRNIEFDGRDVEVYSDLQTDNSEYHCRNLSKENASCLIHQFNPFSCDFETLRFKQFAGEESNQFSNQPFGRAWNMKRFDGVRGAMCEWRDDIKKDPEWIVEVVRKLKRLLDWCNHFRLKTTVPEIIHYVETGPHSSPLILGQKKETGFGLLNVVS